MSTRLLARTSPLGIAIAAETGPRWSPDGRFLVELALDQRHVRFRSARNLEVIGEQDFAAVETSIGAFAISLDGKRIALVDAATIVLAEIDFSGGEAARRL